ncbi:MAG: DUF6503 family protein [Bacteroidota bacterium]
MKKVLICMLLGAVMSPALAQTQEMPMALEKVMQAHGGMDLWKSLGGLVFQKGEGEGAEKHITNLWDRRIRIENANHTIGFDGTDVWVSPADAEMRGSARFYHNLYFYFYAMPFVLGDPGIYYEVVEDLELMGKSYGGVKVSYAANVGDSPDDNYILYFDKATHQMEWLMYTVTYRSGEPSNKYSLIKYGDWQDVPAGGANSVRLPKSLTWYTYQDGVVGEARSTAEFPMVSVSAQPPVDERFVRPEDSRIDPKQ